MRVRKIQGLYENHHDYYFEVKKLPYIQKDEIFRKKSIENVINNHKKYIKNWMANVGRLVFSYPYSYTYQKLTTYFNIVPNIFL